LIQGTQRLSHSGKKERKKGVIRCHRRNMLNLSARRSEKKERIFKEKGGGDANDRGLGKSGILHHPREEGGKSFSLLRGGRRRGERRSGRW